MESHNKKKEMETKADPDTIELITIIVDKEMTNYRRQVTGKEVSVQTGLTATMIDDLQKSDRQQVTGKDVGVQTGLAETMIDDLQKNDRQQVTGKDVGVQTGLTETMIDDLQKNDRQQVKGKEVDVPTEKMIGKDAGVQTEFTATMTDDQQTDDRHHVMNEDVHIKSNPADKFDRLRLEANREETFDENHVTIVMADSGSAPNNSMTKNRRVVEPTTVERDLTTMNIIHDISADLAPIVGYANEPLLPLSKACSPLTNIIHNLSFYVQMAIEETSEQPLDGLTVDESAAIRLYTIEWDGPHRSLYSMLNHTLKNDDREHLRPYFKYLKLFVTALVKLPCVPQLTVWRGVTKDLSKKFPPGTPVTWWAFSSCTTELTVLENNMYLGNTGSRTLFSVEAINGRTIRAHSHFVTEDEILLLPGTHMIVQSQFSPATDLHIIHLKQVKPEQVLLEPPFEGNRNLFNHLF
ncbi:unnamed protein product [Sphagnum balticum]